MNTDERLTDLEIRITHQEDMIDELNKELYRQHLKITDLESLIKELAVRLVDIESGRPINEPPPHY
ncbi:MAG: SlyX family protein [Oxalobacter sp.]|jgi:SlyX protein|nr:SlyX family protein [Oxalobacter sp.]